MTSEGWQGLSDARSFVLTLLDQCDGEPVAPEVERRSGTSGPSAGNYHIE